MEPKYWDDLEIGQKFSTLGRTVTQADIMIYEGLIRSLQPLVNDKEFWEKKGPFGKQIAPGPLTLALFGGLFQYTGLFAGTTVGLLGMEHMRFPAPVFADDTIRGEFEVTEKKEVKKPDRGIFTLKTTVRKQTGEIVLEFDYVVMVSRRK